MDLFKNKSITLLSLLFILIIPVVAGSFSITFNVKDFGARGDGSTLDTKAIQQAIDACSEAGEGVVLFPKGVYRAGTIHLKSNIRIFIEAGAVLAQSRNMDDYDLPHEQSLTTTADCRFVFLHGNRVENVTIEGPGVIDGNHASDTMRTDGRGPLTFLFENSKGLVLKDFTVKNSPNWSVVFFGCDQVDLIRIKCIDSRRDGINIVCCRNVLYDGVYIEGSGDDAITIKNESKGRLYETGPDHGFLTENIFIRNCVIKNTTHPAIKIGTGSAGVFRNIVIENCIFENTGSVFTIQLMRPAFIQTKERAIENIMISGIVARNVGEMFDISTMGVSRPVIKNLVFDHWIVDGLQKPSVIQGLEEAPVEDIRISNMKVDYQGPPLDHWLKAEHVHGLALDNMHFQLNNNMGTLLKFKKGSNLDWHNIRIDGLSGDKTILALSNIQHAFIHNNQAPSVDRYLYVEGCSSQDIRLINNDFGKPKRPIATAGNVSGQAFYPVSQQVDVVGLDISEKIEPDMTVSVVATLQNKGGAGAYYANVMLDNELIAHQWVWLNEGAAVTETITTKRLYRPGSYQLSIGDQSTELIVEKSPALFALGDTLEVSAPVENGALTWAKVRLKNIGGKRGTETVSMTSGGEVVVSESVTLDPGEIKEVRLQHRFKTEGSHTFKVGDFPEWTLSTYANTEAHYYLTKEGQIIIDAGGRYEHYEEHAVAYLNNIKGDFSATCQLMAQDPTTGSYASIGLAVRNKMTDDRSGGLNHFFAGPKYGGIKYWHTDTDNNGLIGDGEKHHWGGNSLPVYFKMTKQGKTFRVYSSKDGNRWEIHPIKEFVLDHAHEVQDVGIYGFAYNQHRKLCRCVFRDFVVGQPAVR